MNTLHTRVAKLEAFAGNVGQIFAVTSNGASQDAVESHLSSLPAGFSRSTDRIAHIVLNKNTARPVDLEVWNIMPVRPWRG